MASTVGAPPKLHAKIPQAPKNESGRPSYDKTLFSQIVEIAFDAIISTDEDGRIILFNNGAERVFDYDAQEMIGKSVDLLLPKEFRMGHLEHMRQFAIEGRHSRTMRQRRDIFGQRKDGSQFPAKASISCVLDGREKVFTVYLRDLTEVRQLEQITRQARDELAHVNRIAMLGEISTSLAHEVNQPLAAILTNAQVLSRQINSDSAGSDGTGEIVSDIIGDAKRAGDVIRRLRSLVQPGGHEFEMLDVNQLVTDVQNLLDSEFIIQNVPLQVELTPDLPAVFGDRVQLQQVLLNCLTNALDAMVDCEPSKRLLTICTRHTGPKIIEISISDRGVGLEGVAHQHIFDPFYTTKDRGMGMGLAISRTIMKAHGGRLWAENNIGAGATFFFSLQAEKTDSAVDHQDPKDLVAEEQPRLAKVFIVDDDLAFRRALARLVVAEGYAVETFSSAQEFLQHEPSDEISCLVLDLHMPGETGLELQAKLNTRDYTLPIVFITGAGDAESGVSAMKLGAFEFLSKPADDQDILQVITHAIDADRQGRDQYAQRAAAKRNLARLTKRESQIMGLVAGGLRNKQIAYTLGISEKTVKAHRGRVMHKMKAGSVVDLVRISELAGVNPQSAVE